MKIKFRAMNIWKKLIIDPDENYVIKFDADESEADDLISNKITCWFSDFKFIWTECFENGSNMLERVKTLNPLLSTDGGGSSLLKTVTTIPVDETFSKNCRIEKNDDNLVLHMKYYLSDRVPLKFNWRMKKCTEHEFFEQITKRMLWQIGTLQQDNNSLMDLIKRKDQEIEQYKLEGAGPLIRKQLITEPFQLCKDLINIQLFDKDIVGSASGFVTPPPLLPTNSTEKTENVNEQGDTEPKEGKKVPKSRDWKRKTKSKTFDRYKPTPDLVYHDTSDSELSQELYVAGSLPKETQGETVTSKGDTSTTTEERPKKIRKKLNI